MNSQFYYVLFCYIIFLTISTTLSAQERDSQDIKGTYLYASAFKDGLIFSADSRGNFEDGGISKFYVDSLQKLYIVDKYVVGFSGNIRMKDKFVDHFVDNLRSKDFQSPKDVVDTLHAMIKTYIGEDVDNSKFNKLMILSGGYNTRNEALICAIYNGEYYNTSKGSISNHVDSSIREELEMLEVDEARRVIESKIKSYASNQNLINEIGGPITTIVISPTSEPICIANCFHKSWSTWEAFKHYIRKKPQCINLTGAKNIDEAMNILNKFK